MPTLALAVALALLGQPAAPAPRLSAALGEKIRSGAGVLSEADVLRLVPGPVTAARPPRGGADADLVLTWEEVNRAEVVLVNGKVTTATATFCPTAPAGPITLATFKKVRNGMTLAELEGLLGQPGSRSEIVDDMNATITRCTWVQGRRVTAYLKDGVVNGGGFEDSVGR
ncbi:MAG: hypothetical protein U0871_30005 [Gemmataceae bacterium]